MLFDSEGLDTAAKGALLSPCCRYRYSLWRRWGPGRAALFIGLNPSTADGTEDDPTIRRCVRYAKAWGYSALLMANLFAWRSTDPSCLRLVHDPVGPENDAVLLQLYAEAAITVAAWGTHGTYLGRGAAVRAMLPKLHALRLTSSGTPGHPLYLPASLVPLPW